MGMQPILPITMLVKKIKSAARQCYGDGAGDVRCEQTLNLEALPLMLGPGLIDVLRPMFDTLNIVSTW